MDPLEAFFCIFLLAFHRVNSLTSFVLHYVTEGQSSTLPRDGTAAAGGRSGRVSVKVMLQLPKVLSCFTSGRILHTLRPPLMSLALRLHMQSYGSEPL